MSASYYVYNSTYNAHMFRPAEFRRQVTEMIKPLREVRAETGFDTIVVSGKSGVTLGFALQMLTDEFPLVVVEKDGVEHHGATNIQGPASHQMHKYVVLDDFIDSGATMERIVDTIERNAKTRGLVVPFFVGAVLYRESGFKKGAKTRVFSRGERDIKAYKVGAIQETSSYI